MSTARQKQSPNARQRGFDFNGHVGRLCQDIVFRLRQLRHIDMARVALSYSQTRNVSQYGMYASLTPMRFAGGRMHKVRGGQKWGVQRLYDGDGREILYILNFYLPRFLELGFREKLVTVVHELWHIGAKFDGDIRRFAGRCQAHGSSQAGYDAQVSALVDRYLASDPPASAYAFLRYDFRQLVARHGRVFGQKIPKPKLLKL